MLDSRRFCCIIMNYILKRLIFLASTSRRKLTQIDLPLHMCSEGGIILGPLSSSCIVVLFSGDQTSLSIHHRQSSLHGAREGGLKLLTGKIKSLSEPNSLSSGWDFTSLPLLQYVSILAMNFRMAFCLTL